MLAAARPAVRGAALGLPRRACCRASSSSSGPAAVTKTKCIGILGGMSPSSTELYYSKLNTSVREALGGLHSADCIIRSVDFEEIAQLQTADRWEDAGELLGQAAAGLEAGGAEVLILATNTMHKVAPAIKRSITIPFIDIFSATAAAVVDAGCSRPLLMATAYTMEQDFCLDRLREAGLSPVVPNAEDRAAIHRIIFDELCKGAENGVDSFCCVFPIMSVPSLCVSAN